MHQEQGNFWRRRHKCDIASDLLSKHQKCPEELLQVHLRKECKIPCVKSIESAKALIAVSKLCWLQRCSLSYIWIHLHLLSSTAAGNGLQRPECKAVYV